MRLSTQICQTIVGNIHLPKFTKHLVLDLNLTDSKCIPLWPKYDLSEIYCSTILSSCNHVLLLLHLLLNFNNTGNTIPQLFPLLLYWSRVLPGSRARPLVHIYNINNVRVSERYYTQKLSPGIWHTTYNKIIQVGNTFWLLPFIKC